MLEEKKLTKNDLVEFQIDRNEAIALIKHYACQYKGMQHYEQLGASCVMSVNSTVNVMIGSASYLDGYCLMPDEVHVERLATWFINNKSYEVPRHALLFYMAHYLKKKVNEYYKAINQGRIIYSTAMGRKDALNNREKQFKERASMGVKRIRC